MKSSAESKTALATRSMNKEGIMELAMTIDITVQDADGNYTDDCKMAEKEFRQRVKNVLATECVYYTFLDTMRTIEQIKKNVELKYEVLIVRNLKKYRFKN